MPIGGGPGARSPLQRTRRARHGVRQSGYRPVRRARLTVPRTATYAQPLQIFAARMSPPECCRPIDRRRSRAVRACVRRAYRSHPGDTQEQYDEKIATAATLFAGVPGDGRRGAGGEDPDGVHVAHRSRCGQGVTALGSESSAGFNAGLPVFTDFVAVGRQKSYAPLPDDWLVALCGCARWTPTRSVRLSIRRLRRISRIVRMCIRSRFNRV